MTRAVLFDFYGTLPRAVTWGPTREEVLARHGYTIPDGVRAGWLDATLDGLDHAEHSVSRDRYRAWERERLRVMVEACGVGPDEAVPLVDELYGATKSFMLEAYPDAVAALDDLRQAGLVVAVCSNWDWDLDRAMGQAGLTGLVDVCVTSARAGARKPHPRIFERALDECGVRPEEAVFVGDSVGPDVEGPARVGMRPVHVWRQPDPPPPLPRGAERVADLRAVAGLVT